MELLPLLLLVRVADGASPPVADGDGDEVEQKQQFCQGGGSFKSNAPLNLAIATLRHTGTERNGTRRNDDDGDGNRNKMGFQRWKTVFFYASKIVRFS